MGNLSRRTFVLRNCSFGEKQPRIIHIQTEITIAMELYLQMLFRNHRHRCCVAATMMINEHADVLTRRNQPILNLHIPQSAPPCAFETMVDCRIGETAFHQMLSPPAVALSPAATRLGSGLTNPVMMDMPFDL